MCLPCHQRHLLEQKLTEEGSILCRMSLVDKCHKPALTDNPKSSLYGRFCSTKCYQAYRQIDWCQHCKDARQDSNIDDEISPSLLHKSCKQTNQRYTKKGRGSFCSAGWELPSMRICRWCDARMAVQGWQCLSCAKLSKEARQQLFDERISKSQLP